MNKSSTLRVVSSPDKKKGPTPLRGALTNKWQKIGASWLGVVSSPLQRQHPISHRSPIPVPWSLTRQNHPFPLNSLSLSYCFASASSPII